MSGDTSSLTLKRAVMRTKSGRARHPLSESRRPVSELFNTNKDFTSEGEDSGIESQSASSTLSSDLSKQSFSRKVMISTIERQLP